MNRSYHASLSTFPPESTHTNSSLLETFLQLASSYLLLLEFVVMVH